MRLRLLLADDHGMFREGLRALIEKQTDLEVVGEAANGREAVRLARDLKPTVVVMDVSMPDLNGVEATRRILKRSPMAKVIALSMHSDRRFVVEMLRAGAQGYLLKDCAYEELVRAIRTVAGGGVYLSPRIAGVVLEDCVRRPVSEAAAPAPALTAREREVLQLLAEGHGTKQIAARLNVSTKTIDTHRRNIMNRLDIRSVAELTKYAVREGLTTLEC